eukprot:2253868-Alexandrium_andersonii.AAC.1
MLSQISAQHFSVLCFWAARAGMPGLAGTYGLAPGASSGNYSRHLDLVLGLGEAKKYGYKLKTVGHERGGMERKQVDVTLKPPHELVNADFEKSS